MGQVVNSINRLVDSTVNALEEERAIEKSKDELITNVSHDIRTPLTSILGYLGLIVNQPKIDTEDAKTLCRNRIFKSRANEIACG